MKNIRSILAMSLLIGVASAEAKESCEIHASPSSISFTSYRPSFLERLSNRWRGQSNIQQITDLTGKLDNAALNRVDRVEISFRGGGENGKDSVRIFAPESLKVRDGQIILLESGRDRVLSEVNSAQITNIRGVRFENPAREEFESLPLLTRSHISVGDHVSLLLHRSLLHDPEYRLRLIPDGSFLTGQVLSLTQGSTDPHVLLVDRHRRLYRFPLNSVAEFREPLASEVHPNVEAEATLRSFGKTWGPTPSELQILGGDHALNALRFYRGRTNAVILVKALPRIGTAVIAINPVDRMDIVFGPDSMRLPWLDLTIPYRSVQIYADDNTNN